MQSTRRECRHNRVVSTVTNNCQRSHRCNVQSTVRLQMITLSQNINCCSRVKRAIISVRTLFRHSTYREAVWIEYPEKLKQHNTTSRQSCKNISSQYRAKRPGRNATLAREIWASGRGGEAKRERDRLLDDEEERDGGERRREVMVSSSRTISNMLDGAR